MLQQSATFNKMVVTDWYIDRVGYGDSFPLTQYDDRHKRYRQMFHKFFSSSRAKQRFMDIKSIEIRRLLARIVQDPDSLEEHLHKYVKSIISALAPIVKYEMLTNLQ